VLILKRFQLLQELLILAFESWYITLKLLNLELELLVLSSQGRKLVTVLILGVE